MKSYIVLVLFLMSFYSKVNAEDKLPKIYFKNIVLVVDDITFKGIAKSAFMTKKFANIDAGLPKFGLPNDTSSSLFVNGKNTYVEILNSKNPYGLKEGQIRIGFSVEEVNAAKEIYSFYDSLFFQNPIASFYLDSLDVSGKKVASEFTVRMNNAGKDAALSYSVTEYHSDLMLALYKKNMVGKSIKRSDFLKKRYNTDKLLSDITEINLEISQNETTPFLEALNKLDFSVSGKNNTYVAKGNDIVIRIKVTDKTIPKVQLKFKLNSSKDGSYNLNNSKMDFGGNYGSWNFY